MNKKLSERCLDAIADQAAHAGGVVGFPLRGNGEWHDGGPAGKRAGRQQDGIANSFVALTTPVEHAGEHGNLQISVVVDLHDLLVRVKAVQAAGVLGDGAAPTHWHGEEQSIEPGIIEALAKEAAGGDEDAGLIGGDGGQLIESCGELFAAHAAQQGDDMGKVGA